MKKLIAFITILAGLLSATGVAYADSPVTSTPFSKAYYDIEIVEEASRRNKITDEMVEYLADENNPIDVKAAIINALSWNISGKNNAELYCQMVYEKPLKEIDGKALSGDQQFCIGYLLAMDDIYFSTNQSVEYLRMARDNMPDSLTVALVTYLVEAMNEVAYDASEQLNQILTDVSLKRDLSEEAIEIITNYMILGIDQPVNIPKTGVKSKGKIYGISAFVLLILAFTVKYILHKKSKKKD